MAFEKCDNPECSGCRRVDAAEWYGDEFSGVAYRGEYALLTVPLYEMITLPEALIGVELGVFPRWISTAIFVGDGSLDEAIELSYVNKDEPVWLAWETHDGDDPEVQHELIADSMSLFVGSSAKMTTRAFVDNIIEGIVKK